MSKILVIERCNPCPKYWTKSDCEHSVYDGANGVPGPNCPLPESPAPPSLKAKADALAEAVSVMREERLTLGYARTGSVDAALKAEAAYRAKAGE